MNIQHPLPAFLVFAALTVFMSGCMPLRPETDPQMDQKALSLSNEVRSFNRHITASKGKGWAKLESQGKADRYRMAWAAVQPDKIRITFLMSGNPVETVVSTGEKISFLSHTGKHDPYTSESNTPDMEDYLGVPIKMSELIAILLGHIPLKNFNDAYFSPLDSSLETVITREKEKNGLQFLNFNDNRKINRIQSKDNFETLLFEILVLAYVPHGSDDIPAKLQIRDKENRILTLEITDFEPNPPIKDAVFELTE